MAAMVPDSRLGLDVLRRVVGACRRVPPLTIGERPAVAITVRVVLVEDLRRVPEAIAGPGEEAEPVGAGQTPLGA